jgi:DNA-binding SARP family transcriptional activator
VTARSYFGVLGPLLVTVDGEPVRLGGPKERLVLATLLASGGRVVSVDRLVDVLWGEQPPSRAVATVQVHVSNLRRRLGEVRPTVCTQAPGYIVAASAETLDLLRLDELVDAARQAMDASDPARAAARYAEADRLWRGDALADLESNHFVETTRALLEERRVSVGEARIDALLRSGQSTEALPVIAPLLESFPLRETLWEARMLTLYRMGRQADALLAYQQCRRGLLDELGVEPATRVRELHRAILAQDPALDLRGVVPEQSRPGPGLAVPEPAVTFMVGKHPAELVVGGGPAVSLVGVTTIGRHPDSVVLLEDGSVSRRHAEIRPALGGHLLMDLGSSNGTRVAGEVVVQHLLEDGDEIGIGPHRLTYRRVAGS